MYLDRFGLERPPFEETTSPRFCYETAAVRAICDAAVLQVEAGSGLVLVQGQTGTGRTMLGRVLAERMPGDVRPLTVTPSVSDATPLISRLGAALQIPALDGENSGALVAAMVHAAKQHNCLHYVVIVDDAEYLTAVDLAALDQMLLAADQAELKITIILLATAALQDILQLPQFTRLAQLVRYTGQLTHLRPHETGAYVEARLAAAGWSSGELFTAEAVERISRIANGHMRQINALARQALIRADRLGLACIDADQIPEPAGQTAPLTPARGPRSETSMDPKACVSSPDLVRMERILERFAEIAATAPQRLAELDAGLARLTERAEDIVRTTADRVEQLEESCARADTTETAIKEQLPQFERITGDAKRVQRRLDEFVQKLGDIDAASEERIALLLSGLESATAIHDKLESAGEQVSTLIDEARHTAMAERESLVKVFDDLSTRREELSATIDTLRHQRQTILEENEVAVGDMVQRCRTDAAQACAASAEALAEARRTAENNRAALTEQASLASRKLADARNACMVILDQVHSVQADIETRHAALIQSSTRFDERISALAEASEKSAKLTAGAQQAADRLGETLGQAQKTGEALGRDIDMAAHLRDNCVTTLERLQADGVRALEQNSAAAEQRLSDAIARFETLVATEQKARAVAEEAVRSARTALASVQQSEAKLADAQAAAINIEATASAALTTVQQQIKRFEDSVEIIVKHGVDRARSEVVTLLDGCGKRVEENAAALEQAADAAIKRMYGEIGAVQTRWAAERERVKTELKASVEAAALYLAETLGESKAQAAQAVAEATNTITTCGNDASDRIESIASCGSERIRREIADAVAQMEATTVAGRAAVDLDVSQASTAIRTAITNALSQMEAGITAGRDAIDLEVSQATAALNAACTNAMSRTEEHSCELLTATEAELSRRHEDMRQFATTTADRLDTELSLFTAMAQSAIEQCAHDRTDALETTADAADQRIAHRIASLEQDAQQALDEKLAYVQTASEQTLSRTCERVTSLEQSTLRTLDEQLTYVETTVEQSSSRFNERVTSLTQESLQNLDEKLAHVQTTVEETSSLLHERVATLTQETLQALDEKLAHVQTTSHNTNLRTCERVTSLAHETLQELDEKLARVESTAEATETRTIGHILALERAAHQSLDDKLTTVRTTAEATQAETCERITALATGALQSLEGEIDSSHAVLEKLTLMAEETRKIVLEAGTAREQIDHQIRDVWSLTATTDQRVRDLTSLTDISATSEKHLVELIAGAAQQGRTLAAHAEAAGKSIATLAAQHEQVKTLCATFAERITEARQACTAITDANTLGATLAPQLHGWITEVQELMSGARELVDTLHSDGEKLRTQHESVHQLSLMTTGLERKIATLQEALASPITVIQDARSQAEELNDVCLAVKRVFRGVSQASLQANERIKLLGKLLIATERSAHTMKEWVDEASRAQARLAGTLSTTPQIQDTHLLIPLSFAGPVAHADALDLGATIAATDTATMRRLAGMEKVKSVANPSAQPRPTAVPVGQHGSVAKAVIPLVDVLKARQAKGQPAAGQRLSPADVQSMIDAARQPAPTGP